VSYIQTAEALAEAMAALEREPLVAVDTEAASFHRYHDRIFLIQLSSPLRTEIIDPLAVADLSPVAAARRPEGGEDLPRRGLRPADSGSRLRLPGAAAVRHAHRRPLAGEPAVGLRRSWKVRRGKARQGAPEGGLVAAPAPPAMLDYAAADTAHLPALRERLRARLTELGRLAWAEEEFTRLEDLR